MSTATVDVRDSQTPWHVMTVEAACAELSVDPPRRARRRPRSSSLRAVYGAKSLAEAKKEPGWHAFLRQYRT